jgi:hypothetical protein
MKGDPFMRGKQQNRPQDRGQFQAANQRGNVMGAGGMADTEAGAAYISSLGTIGQGVSGGLSQSSDERPTSKRE